MAKYADYVKDRELDTEIQEAQDRRVNIPESVLKRFDGKSTEEILESYYHLETKLSKQGEDMGRLRKTVDQLLELQSHPTQTSDLDVSDGPEDPIDIDALYEDPEEAIGKVADKRVGKRLEGVERQLEEIRVKEAIEAIDSKYEGWQNEVQSPEFLEWVQGSRYRYRLAVQADQFDLDAANDLLEMWYDRKNTEQEAAKKAKRQKQLNDATLESSSPAGVQVPNSYSRSKLLETRLAAKRGDAQAERYLQAHANDIALAYEEGRITD